MSKVNITREIVFREKGYASHRLVSILKHLRAYSFENQIQTVSSGISKSKHWKTNDEQWRAAY